MSLSSRPATRSPRIHRQRRRLMLRSRQFETLERRDLFATLYWDPNGATPGLGGAGTWDLTTANWTTDPTGASATQAWDNGAGDEAVFAGTAGNITLSTAIDVTALTFSTPGYALSGSSLTLGGTAEITADSGVAATISSQLSGSDGLLKSGAGTLTLSGSNSFTGGTEINVGIVVVANDAALSTGTITLSGGKLQAGSGGRTLSNALVAAASTTSGLVSPSGNNLTLNGNLSGSGTLLKTGAYSVFLGGDNSGFAGVFSNRESNLFFNAASAGSAAAAWDNTGGNHFATNFAGNATLSFGALAATSGAIHAGTNLSGTKTFTIGNRNETGSIAASLSNYYSVHGGSILQLVKTGTGTLTLSNTNGFTGGTEISGGTVIVSHNSALGTGTITLSGGTLQAGGGGRTLSNAIIATASTTSGLISPSGSNLTLNGNLSGTGTLLKTGAYSVFLGGDNSGFAGVFSHRQSNLYFSTATAGSAAAAWDITSGNQFAASFSGDATMYFGSLAATTGGIYAGNGSSGTKTFVIGDRNASTTIAATMANDVGGGSSVLKLVKTGTGTLTLSGANSFTGGSEISGDTVIVSHNSALGTGTITLSGGKLQAGSGGRTLSNALVAAASTTSGLVSPSGNNLTLNGNLSGSGTLLKTGAYSVFLGGDNSGFAGVFSNRESNLFFNAASAGSAAAAWDNTGGNHFATNFTGDATLSFGALAGTTGIVSTGSNLTGIKTLVIGDRNEASTFNGVLADYVGTNAGAKLALVKAGTGALTLNGTNTYTSDTTVDAGTLIVASTNNNGQSKAGRGTITINSDATLKVTGSNVFGTGAGLPTQLVINTGGTLTSGDSAFSQLPAVELAGGTIASGEPNAFWGSWAFADGITAVGTDTSTITATNMYLPAGEEIVTATGSTVELAGNFDGSAGYGQSTVVTSGSGTVANTQAKSLYRFTNPYFYKGSSSGVYSLTTGDVLPLTVNNNPGGWIVAGSPDEAVRKAFSVIFTVSGNTFSFGGDNPGYRFDITTYGAIKDEPSYAGPSLSNLDTVIIRFEDWTDWDLNDAYFVFASPGGTGGVGYEQQLLTSEDLGYVCTCDCGCSSATTSPTSNSEVKEKKTAYDSGTVNPKSTVSVTAEIPADQGTPDLIEVQLTFDGVSQPTVFLDPTGLNPGDSFVAAAQADSSTRDTGRYAWNMKVVSHYGSAKFEDNFDGFQDVINRTNSEFGPGWQVNELDQLLLTPEGVNLITGTNQAIWFAEESGDYQVEAGNSQIESLVKQIDDTFTLTFKDGSRSEFSSTGLLTSRVDARGNTRAYSYADEDGDSVVDELSSILDEQGRTTTLAYTSGLLTSLTDYAGEVTSYGYNLAGQLASITEPDPDGAGAQTAPVWQYTYDATSGLLDSIEDPRALVTNISYDFTQRVSAIEQACGGTTAVDPYYTRGVVDLTLTGYDASHPAPIVPIDGLVEYQEDERGNPSWIERDHRGNIIRETNALNETTTYRRDVNGLVTLLTQPDPDGVGPLSALITTFSYDDRGNLLRRVNPDGSIESWTYDATFSQVTKYTDALDRVTKYAVDPANGNVLSMTQVVGLDDATSSETDDVTTSCTYTDGTGGIPTGLLASQTDPLGRLTEMVYDTAGLLLSVTVAVGTADEATTEYEYDARDNVSAVIDPLGRRTEYLYDSLDRLIEQTDPDPDGVGPLTSPVWSYVYDARGNQTQVTDPLRNVTQYVYDDRNRVEQMIAADPDGAGPLTSPITSYVYDCVSNLTSVTDPLGRVTTYTYDELNRLQTTTLPDPDGAGPLASPVTSQTYDSVGNLATSTDALGNVTTYRYDALNRVVEVTQPDPDSAGPLSSPVTQHEYDAAGQVLSTIDPLGRVTSYEYDDLGRLVKTTLPDPDGGGVQTSPEVTTTYDAVGNVLTRTDALGNVTAYEYDALNRLVELTQADPDGVGVQTSPVNSYVYDLVGQLLSSTDPLGRVTSYTYDDLGRQITVTQPDPDGAGPLASPVTSSSYDAMGNLLTTTDPLGNVTAYTYDNLHRQISITEADPDGVGPLTSPVSASEFDAAGQLLSSTDPLGRETTYEYDALGRATKVTQPDPDGAGVQLAPWTTYAYDAVGNVLAMADRLSHTTTYVYDNLYRQTSITNANSETTVYAYDALGNLLSLTDPEANTTTWAYDNLDRVITDTNELNKTRTFEYDAVGNPTKKTDRLGRVTEYTYDNLYRNTAELWKSGGSTIRTLSFEYDAAVQLTSASDPAAVYDYLYDELGHTTEITADIDGLTPDVVLSQAFNLAGNRTQLAANIGGNDDFANDFTYDALRRLIQLTQQSQSGGSTVAEKRVDFAYNTLGQQTLITRYADLAGSEMVATTTSSYDQAHRLTSLAHAQGLSTLASYDYTYDAANRITSIDSLLDGLSEYTHDDTDQLTDANHTGQTDESYIYDDNGNRIMSGHVVGANNRLSTDGTFDYEYDDEGNLTAQETIATGEREEYAWDHRNRLVSITFKDTLGAAVKTVDQTYDVFNRWVRSAVDPDGAGVATATDRYFVYDGNQIVLEFDGSAASDLVNRYLWSDLVDQLWAVEQIASLASAGDVIYPLTDHLSTTRDLATYDAGSATTSIANHRFFDSYGNLVSQTNSSVTILIGYTGRPFDDASGKQWNLNRWYISHLGVWMCEDPIGFEGGQKSLRMYVGNSPTSATDPGGLHEKVYDIKQTESVNQTIAVKAGVFSVKLVNGSASIKFTPTDKTIKAVKWLQVLHITRVKDENIEAMCKPEITKYLNDIGNVSGSGLLGGFRDHISKSGWGVDLDYSSDKFAMNRTPYYSDAYAFKVPKNTCEDEPTPWLIDKGAKEHINDFILGVFAIDPKTGKEIGLGYIKWGVHWKDERTYGGWVGETKTYNMLSTVGLNAAPAEFTAALQAFNTEEAKK